MTDKLEPPPEHRHHRWHWIKTQEGIVPAEWLADAGNCTLWAINGFPKVIGPLQVKGLRWHYIGPAIPPEDEEAAQ